MNEHFISKDQIAKLTVNLGPHNVDLITDIYLV